MSPASSSGLSTLDRDISFTVSMPVTAATSSPSAASSTADLTHIQTRPSRHSNPNGSSNSSSSPSIVPANAAKSPKRSRAPPAFHFLAGLCTGALSAVLLQPADLLKTRVQQTRGTSVAGALRSILNQPGAVRQLWRGTLPSVIRTGFGSALYFASLNTLRASWAGSETTTKGRDGNSAGDEAAAVQDGGRRPDRSMGKELNQVAILAGGDTRGWTGERAGEARYLATSTLADDGPAPALDSTVSVHTPPSIPSISTSTSSASSSSALVKLSNTANLVTGALARGGAGLVMMPITVLKVRYESSLYNSAYAGTSRGLVGAMQTIVSREGVRGLYAGYGATLVRDAPYAGLYVLFYERAKSLLGRVTPTGERDGGAGASASASSGLAAARVNFLAGCGAAAAATAVTNPFDAIKTRIQLMPGRYANTMAAATTMLRDEGPRALFDGLGLRMARKAMSSALAWTLYEDLVRRAEIRYARVAEVQA